MRLHVFLPLALFAGEARAEKSLTPAEIAREAIPSVVLIRSSTGLGSGFVVRADGLIATNHHVLYGASEAVVVLYDGKEISKVAVVAVDEPHDLVLIRVPAKKLRPLPFADPKSVVPGARVVAIGHPLGLGNTVTDGLVSAVRTISPELTLLQVSAPISSGSSGGPLIDDTGRAIGVSTLYSLEGQNLNFGVPIQYLLALIEKGGKPTPIADYRWPGGRGLIERAVPRHDPSLLAQCSSENLEAIVRSITGAIEIGAPLYNQGNHEACFRIYQGAALDLQKVLGECGGKKALADGVKRASEVQGWDAKAWAMRDAFDGLLDAVARTNGGAVEARGPRRRQVPNHPLKLLDGCSRQDLAVVEEAIVSAIDIGAPLYNQGNIEACFRVYEGAILNLLRNDEKGCRGAETALKKGLERAAGEKTYDDKAWALRDAFDGVLDVIARKIGGT
jgi:hypothetical protein